MSHQVNFEFDLLQHGGYFRFVPALCPSSVIECQLRSATRDCHATRRWQPMKEQDQLSLVNMEQHKLSYVWAQALAGQRRCGRVCETVGAQDKDY